MATLPGSVVVWPGTIVSLCNIRVPKLKPDHARATLGREKDMVGGDAEEELQIWEGSAAQVSLRLHPDHQYTFVLEIFNHIEKLRSLPSEPLFFSCDQESCQHLGE